MNDAIEGVGAPKIAFEKVFSHARIHFYALYSKSFESTCQQSPCGQVAAKIAKMASHRGFK